MKYTATVRIGTRTMTASTMAQSALDAKYKIASAALSANPGRDIVVSEVKEAESVTVTDFFSKIFNFSK